MLEKLRALNLLLSLLGGVTYLLRQIWAWIRPQTKQKELSMGEAVGVKEMKEVVDAVLDCVDLGKAVAADGKVDLGDLDDLLKALPGLVGSVSAAVKDASQIVPEAKDLSAEELAELGAHVMARLAVANEKAVKVVEASLKVAASVLGLVKAIQA
jgi:hypothetical protein